MKLRVIGVVMNPDCHAGNEHHRCEDVEGNLHRVDLYVGLQKDSNIHGVCPKDLVGKTVEVDWLQPHLELAQNAVIVEELND